MTATLLAIIGLILACLWINDWRYHQVRKRLALLEKQVHALRLAEVDARHYREMDRINRR